MTLRILSLAAALLLAGAAAAHHATPREVLARLRSDEMRREYGITSAEIAADLPRLLIVRVGPSWGEVDPLRRVSAAEAWYTLWRDAVPNGIVAIVDAGDHPLVNFDSRGRARLQDAATPRPSPPPPS